MNTKNAVNLDVLSNARDLIDSSWQLPLSLEHISKFVGFSRSHFIRAFRRTYGISPHRYLTRRRIEKAQYLLAHTEMTVTDICFEIGFKSLGSFSAQFRRYTGCSPIHHRMTMQKKQAQLRRTVPACYITMLGIDKTISHTTEHFSRSQETTSEL